MGLFTTRQLPGYTEQKLNFVRCFWNCFSAVR